jgi:hypothetical protein
MDKKNDPSGLVFRYLSTSFPPASARHGRPSSISHCTLDFDFDPESESSCAHTKKELKDLAASVLV